MYIEEKQLKSFIADSGLISKADLEAADAAAKKEKISIGKALLAKGKMSEDDLRRVQAYVLGIPFVDLKTQKIDFAVLSLIPEPIARAHNILAFRKSGDSLEVAMLDTEDLPAIDFV